MRLKLFLVTLAALLGAEAPAQILSTELSFRPAFFSTSASTSIAGNEISHQTELNLNKSNTLYELCGAIHVSQAAIKGYYLFPKTISGDGRLNKLIVDPKAKDELFPVSASYALSSGRVELAVPYRLNRACLIEPSVVYQSITQTLSITGANFNYTDTPKMAAFGLGIEITESFSAHDSLNAKLIATQNSSLFSLKYRRNDNRGHVGVGYDWWNIDALNTKIRMSGPCVEVGVKF